jgi:hypothetical protein
MHERDRALLELIQVFFGGIGYISKPNKDLTVEFRVNKLSDLVNVIIPHFKIYPLITKKQLDYLLFKQIIDLMKNKEHNTLEGIKKVMNLKASLNWGLSEELKEAFPDIISTDILDNYSENKTIYNNLPPEWVAGFSTGESNFFISVQKSKSKSGLTVSMRFTIAQHSRDLLLLESLIKFFGGGYVVKYKNRPLCEFTATKIGFIIENIIPFFEKYPILGSKNLNFLDFKTASYIINSKQHLDEDRVGLNKVLELKKLITSRYKK